MHLLPFPSNSRTSPTNGARTLVTYHAWRETFPKIAGQMLPQGPLNHPLMDFGFEEKNGLLLELPPTISDKEGYVILVPQVDSDGNELDGLKAPMAAVPLGTYVGWNILKRGFGHGAISWLTKGGYIPFPDTEDEAQMSGDPRVSIGVRYQVEVG